MTISNTPKIRGAASPRKYLRWISGGLVVLGIIMVTYHYVAIPSSGRISRILGGPSVVALIRSPDKVQLFPALYSLRMETNETPPFPDYLDTAGPGTNLPSATIKDISQLLLKPESYE